MQHLNLMEEARGLGTIDKTDSACERVLKRKFICYITLLMFLIALFEVGNSTASYIQYIQGDMLKDKESSKLNECCLQPPAYLEAAVANNTSTEVNFATSSGIINEQQDTIQ